jgi:hypothetical protein
MAVIHVIWGEAGCSSGEGWAHLYRVVTSVTSGSHLQGIMVARVIVDK